MSKELLKLVLWIQTFLQLLKWTLKLTPIIMTTSILLGNGKVPSQQTFTVYPWDNISDLNVQYNIPKNESKIWKMKTKIYQQCKGILLKLMDRCFQWKYNNWLPLIRSNIADIARHNIAKIVRISWHWLTSRYLIKTLRSHPPPKNN